jgi:eukaryotic translation initiation factor 2C
MVVQRPINGLHSSSVFAAGQPAVIDSRLMDNSQDALIASFKSLKLRHDDLPLRPGFGTVGVPIKLRANFFPVKVPKGSLYEYDVAITPTSGTAIKRVRRRIFQLAEDSRDWTAAGLKGFVAHDHASKLIAAKKLQQPLTIKVPFYDEDESGPKDGGKEYTLTITFVQTMETESLLKYAVLYQLVTFLTIWSYFQPPRRPASVPWLRYPPGNCSAEHNPRGASQP